jgi:hypothetical protein
MMRGHAVEYAVETKLKEEKTDTKKLVTEYYDKLGLQNKFDKTKLSDLRVGLPEMVEEACTQLSKYGTLISAQDWLDFKIQVEIEGEHYDVPMTGRTDFFMESKDGARVLVDLKTTSRMPSVVPFSTRIQQVLYTRATNYRTELLYVGYGSKGVKSKTFEVENDSKIIQIVKQTIVSMETLLRLSDDRDVLKNIIVPNPDDWSWNDDNAYRKRKEVWGW